MEIPDEPSNNSESHQVKRYDLEDALVYKLASRLGGRSEVVNMPLVDALAFLLIVMEEEEREAEEKAVDLYMAHLSRIMSNPAQSDEQSNAQQSFVERLEPKSFKKPKTITDQATLDRFLEQQNAQMQQLN